MFNNDQNGFSLLEVLIGITVLGFLMIGVYTIIDNSIKTKDRVTIEDSRMMEVEAGLARFEADFSQIYSPLYFSPKFNKRPDNKEHNGLASFKASENFPLISDNGLPVPLIDAPSRDTMIFMTHGNRRKMANAKQSHYSWIKYSLTDRLNSGKTDFPYTLLRQVNTENIYAANTRWDDIKSQILIRNIKSIEFEFFDKKKKRFTSSLNDLGEEKYRLQVMKLTLKWADALGFEQTSIRTLRVLYPYFNTEKDQKEMAEQNNNASDPPPEDVAPVNPPSISPPPGGSG